MLRKFSSMTAAAILRTGDSAASAIRILAKARGLLWDRLLNNRTPVDDLKAADEGMAKRIIEIRDAILAPASTLPLSLTAEDHNRVGVIRLQISSQTF